MDGYTAVVQRPIGNQPSNRQKMLAVVPIMVLGLLAAACMVSSADWKGEKPVVMALGAGEEVAAAHAIVTASKIDPDAVTAQNPAVDASIMKEVEKAEKEQADEMDTEKAFAVGNEVVRDDGTGKKLAPAKGANKDAKTESLVRAVGWKK